jgi:general secretion pathway protein K
MKRRAARSGVVLPVVLWLITLLSALAMAASVTFRGFVGVMTIDRLRLQADALLTAGLEASAAMIEALGDVPLREIESTVTLSAGSVRTHLEDEGGRIDIGKAPVEVLAALLRSVGASPPAADGIARRVVGLRGSSKPAEGGTRVATEQPFTNILQLARIPGMRPEWLNAMVPLATVYGSETVNPFTAPRGVIAALPGVSGTMLESFLAARRSLPADANRLARLLGPAEQYLAAKPQRVAAVEMTARVADGYVAAARAVIVVLPQDQELYRVLVFAAVPPPGV